MDSSLFNYLLEIRRKIHVNPELGYQEFETADLVCKELDSIKIPYRRNIAKTGVIAELKKGNGPIIALRADLDALPIKEETNLSFASQKIGKNFEGQEIPLMHACGHDLHTTILLGAAHELKDKEFKGTIKFIFQPSEEGTDGDKKRKSGGQNIVETGVLDDVKAALGLHVYPTLPVGKLAFVPGQALANVNFFKISIDGEAAHAGLEPEKGKDAIIVAVQLVQQCQLIVSRLTSPTEPVVISFTQIQGGTNQNIIASNVILKGAIRALDLKTYGIVMEKVKKIIKGLESIYEVKIKLEIELYFPSLLNELEIHNKLIPTLNSIFGENNIIKVNPFMGGEDFAFYTRKVPSFFYFLGARNTSNEIFSLHHPKVVFNEECIAYGVDLLSESALALLKMK